MAVDQPEQQTGARGILANAGWLYLDQGVRAVLALAAFSAVARHLGPEVFGVLSYAVAFPALFLPIATLGLEYVVVQEIVRRPGQTAVILGTAGRMLAVATLVGLGLGVLGLQWVGAGHPARPLIWLTLGSLLAQPLQVCDYFFQSRMASRYTVIARITGSVAGNGLRLALVAGDAALGWFAAAFAIEALAAAVVLAVAFRRSRGGQLAPWREWETAEAGRLWRSAWPLMAGGVAMACYLRLDQLLLERLAGAAELGLYAAAARLGEASQFVTYALILSYFPRFVSAHGEGEARFARARDRFFAVITWVAVAVAVAVTVAAPWITRVLLGAGYADSSGILVWMAWANVFAAQIGVRGKWFLLEGRQLWSLLFFALGAVVHLAGVWWLAPQHGARGAAISFCAAQVLMALAAPLLSGKTRLAAFAAWRSFLPLTRP